MILTGRMLAHRDAEENIISPFLPRGTIFGMSYGLSLAGYDFRIKQSIELKPGGFALASSMERFQIPLDIMGICHDKSSWARRGIAVQNTVFEPGWRGWATLEISNHGLETVEIMAGSPIAQMVFHQLTEEVVGYSGKYQDQANHPVHAIKEGN